MTHLVKVAFYGEQIEAVVIDSKQYISVTPICEFIGLSSNRQIQKLKSDPTYEAKLLSVQTPGGVQKVFCIPLDKLNGWLFTINPNKTKPEVREKLIIYKKECFEVLHNHFMKKISHNGKDVHNIINGYKSQIVQKNNKIALLKAELTKLKNQLPAPATDLDELHVKLIEANRMILEGTRHQLNAALESIITIQKRRDKT